MRVDINELAAVTCVTVAGRIDARSSPDLWTRLQRLRLIGGTSVVIDATEAEFTDDSGLRVVMRLRASLGSQGRGLALATRSSRLRMAFQFLRHDPLFFLVADAEAGRRALHAAELRGGA